MTDRRGGVGRDQDPGQHLVIDRIGPEAADVAPGGQDPVEGGAILGGERPAPRVGGPLGGAGSVADRRHGTGPGPHWPDLEGATGIGAYDSRA